MVYGLDKTHSGCYQKLKILIKNFLWNLVQSKNVNFSPKNKIPVFRTFVAKVDQIKFCKP